MFVSELNPDFVQTQTWNYGLFLEILAGKYLLCLQAASPTMVDNIVNLFSETITFLFKAGYVIGLLMYVLFLA